MLVMAAACSHAVTWPVAAVLIAAILAGTVMVCFAAWAGAKR